MLHVICLQKLYILNALVPYFVVSILKNFQVSWRSHVNVCTCVHMRAYMRTCTRACALVVKCRDMCSLVVHT